MRLVPVRLGLLFPALFFLGTVARAAECPALPPPYSGPVFDAAVQSWNPSVTELLDVTREAGVRRIALFANARLNTGGQGMAVAMAERREAVLAFARAHPDLVVPGAPKIGFIDGGDLPDRYVSETLAGITGGTYRFIGEILYTHGDKPDHPPTPGGEVYVDPLAPGTARLLSGLQGRAPLLTHWEAWAWDRDRPRFDRLYSTWPAQRFVLASLVYGSAGKAEALLAAHPNVWGIISRVVDGRYHFVDPAKEAKLGPPMADDCGVLRPDWRALLIKYAGRLMYGSDDYATPAFPWSVYPRIVGRWRRIAGQLPPDVARRISWDTASALYGAQ